MLFVEDFLPLLVVVYAARFDDDELKELAAGFEPHFKRGERYAVLSLSIDGFARIGARERKLIADWANTDRVMDASRRLGVASSPVLPSAMARAALTALFWLWTPPTPVYPAATFDEGLDVCLRALVGAGLALGRSSEAVRLELLDRLRDLGDFGGALRPSSDFPASSQLCASPQLPSRGSRPP